MAVNTHSILPLALLCIITTVIIYTDDINGTPIKRSATDEKLENLTNYVGQAFPEVVDLLQNIASSQNNVLPTIVNFLEEDKMLQASQKQLMANCSDRHISTLQQIYSLLEENLDRQNELLEIQQGMQQQMISSNYPIRDCASVVYSGQYTISPPNNNALGPFPVYCDIDTNGDGWIVIQRRFDGSVDFDRNWVDYERGFGNLDGEFWIGLEKLHVLTSGSSSRFHLRVELHDFGDTSAYALYKDFKVGDSTSLYRLSLGSYSAYSGTAGNAMLVNNGHAFSTKDRDNDRWSAVNCALRMRSGWWHGDCTWANPNGLYLGENTSSKTGLTWYTWKRSWDVELSLKKCEMKIRLVA